jgi:hypothetical protein
VSLESIADWIVAIVCCFLVACLTPGCIVTLPRQDDEVLFSYTSHPAVAKYVEAIIGEDFKSVHTMLINKPPEGVRSGEEQQKFAGSSRHPPHQDLWYFPFRPVSFALGAWNSCTLARGELCD